MNATARVALENFKGEQILVKKYEKGQVVDENSSFEKLMSDDTCIKTLIESILEALSKNATCSFDSGKIIAMLRGTPGPFGGPVLGNLNNGKIDIP